MFRPRRGALALAMPSRGPYVSPVLRTMTRFLIALALVIATSLPGFARVMPMTQSAASPMDHTTAALSVCLGRNCPGHHHSGRTHHNSMGARCVAAACTNAAALPVMGAGAVAVIGTTIVDFR